MGYINFSRRQKISVRKKDKRSLAGKRTVRNYGPPRLAKDKAKTFRKRKNMNKQSK